MKKAILAFSFVVTLVASAALATTAVVTKVTTTGNAAQVHVLCSNYTVNVAGPCSKVSLPAGCTCAAMVVNPAPAVLFSQ